MESPPEAAAAHGGTRKVAYCLGDVAQQLDGESLESGSSKRKEQLGVLQPEALSLVDTGYTKQVGSI